MQTQQKDFMDAFDTLCAWNSRYERWCDVITLFALAINTSCDRREDVLHQRIDEYDHIISRYSDDERRRLCDLFDITVGAMDVIPIQDYLGDMFMRLGLGSQVTGQFFTPPNIAGLLSSMAIDDVIAQIDRNGWASIHDPACGGGATLLAAAGTLLERGYNFQQSVMFAGQDLDRRVAMTCYVQMALFGLPGWVRIGDTLRDPPAAGNALVGPMDTNTFYTPMYFHPVWTMRTFLHRHEIRDGGDRL